MAKRSKATGIYLRCNIRKIASASLSLDTKVFTEKVLGANHIRANPELSAGDTFKNEIEAFQTNNGYLDSESTPREMIAF
jgi:hypothetical protein